MSICLLYASFDLLAFWMTHACKVFPQRFEIRISLLTIISQGSRMAIEILEVFRLEIWSTLI